MMRIGLGELPLCQTPGVEGLVPHTKWRMIEAWSSLPYTEKVKSEYSESGSGPKRAVQVSVVVLCDIIFRPTTVEDNFRDVRPFITG